MSIWFGLKTGCGSWPLGRLGRIQGEKYFRILIEFWNLSRLWKFVQGDLKGILKWGFFLNYSRLSKDFRKIQYVMTCNATKAELI
jgi:hypothetical protein